MNHKQVMKQISIVLLRNWDPIGISDEPACADEYETYVPQVLSLLGNGVSVDVLAQHLSDIETNEMGLRPEEGANRAVAQKLIEIAVD